MALYSNTMGNDGMTAGFDGVINVGTQISENANLMRQLSMQSLSETGGGLDSTASSLHDFTVNGGDFENNQSSFQHNFAAKESSKVALWRKVVLFLMFVNAAFVLLSTYIYLSKGEVNDFVAAFLLSVKIIEKASRFHSSDMIDGLQTLSEVALIHAESLDSVWPFVTIPKFESIGAHARFQAFADSVTFCPIVEQGDQIGWQKYSLVHQNWIQESFAIYDESIQEHQRKNISLSNVEDEEKGQGVEVMTLDSSTSSYSMYSSGNEMGQISSRIYSLDSDGRHVQQTKGPFLPIWQMSPPPDHVKIINYDVLSRPEQKLLYNEMLRKKHFVLSDILGMAHFLESAYTGHATNRTDNNQVSTGLIGSGDNVDNNGTNTTNDNNIKTTIFQPIFNKYHGGKLVGLIMVVISWDVFLSKLLPADSIYDGVLYVLENSCGQVYTYESYMGGKIRLLGHGDYHDDNYENLGYSIELFSLGEDEDEDLTQDNGRCRYAITIFPSDDLLSKFQTRRPAGITGFLLVIFLVTLCAFMFFIRSIRNRQNKVMALAVRTNNVVSAMFPSNVRGRIMREVEERARRDIEGKGLLEIPKSQLKSFLADEADDDEENKEIMLKTKPIADLFPNCTVMFADIVGFTAWSSVREPCQVFELLETIYYEFDRIAKSRRVFKVETVGDCYVAVAGLPDPRKDHAVVMARFARDCLYVMHAVTKKLEVTLGPDTTELSMRVGLHSGAVTAGVLRGERSRFQLFGDTVNTASRMESTGTRDRIQISAETSILLTASGKAHWFTPREEKIHAKGKGDLQTYWLETSTIQNEKGSKGSNRSVSSSNDNQIELNAMINGNTLDNSNSSAEVLPGIAVSDKHQRLIDWNVEQLARLVKQIVARRLSMGRQAMAPDSFALSLVEDEHRRGNAAAGDAAQKSTVLDEVREIITLPKFDPKVCKKLVDPMSVELHPKVVAQLRAYVSAIYTMYRDNSFHNFEHASHVTMSVMKLLSRIVTPDEINYNKESLPSSEAQRMRLTSNILHDYSYGITSDPLTQFAVVLSALIHDVDHVGVPNAQLVKEKSELALLYNNRSVAEQNSVDLAWDLLMDSSFNELRAVICYTEEEMKRFRQIVINTVMATDIADKELKILRNNRWEKAFSEDQLEKDKDAQINVNRKATIVIEHLIQASDVSHTMQHWHVYRKWNERLFHEMYEAYIDGRADKDPTDFWYKGELGFFDFYIIPLAKKLKECGVFGVFSDDYLSYAVANRAEWELKGESVVAEMIASLPVRDEPETASDSVSTS